MNQASYDPDSFLHPDETDEKFKTLKTNILRSLESTVDDLKTMGFSFVNLATNEEEDEFLSDNHQYENLYCNTTEKLNNLNITEASGRHATDYHTVCLKNNFSNTEHQRQSVQLCVGETEAIKNWGQSYLQELQGIISLYIFQIHNEHVYPQDEVEKLSNFLHDLLKHQENFQNAINSAGCLEEVAQTFMNHVQLFDCYNSFLDIADQLPLELTIDITKTVTESISIMSTLLNGLMEYKATLEKITNIQPVEFKRLIKFLDGLIKRILPDRDIEHRPKIMLDNQDVTSFEYYGKYLQTDIFKGKTPYKTDVALHMFTRALVISEKKKNDTWKFLDHIYLNHALLLSDVTKKSCKVEIQDMDKSRIKHTAVIYKFKASSEDARQIWLDKFKTVMSTNNVTTNL